MDTKEAILETALCLFNRDGASAVTTRHIADEMKISPGNLYYHYSNREEIIRVLMQRLYDEFNAIYLSNSIQDDPISAISHFLDKPVNVMFRYRFFYMEPVILLEKDPQLKKLYFRMKKYRLTDFKKIYEFMTSSGILVKTISEEEFEAGFNNVWALSEFIIQSMYMNNEKITEANMKRNFYRIMYIIKPFVTDRYRDKLFPVS